MKTRKSTKSLQKLNYNGNQLNHQIIWKKSWSAPISLLNSGLVENVELLFASEASEKILRFCVLKLLCTARKFRYFACYSRTSERENFGFLLQMFWNCYSLVEWAYFYCQIFSLEEQFRNQNHTKNFSLVARKGSVNQNHTNFCGRITILNRKIWAGVKKQKPGKLSLNLAWTWFEPAKPGLNLPQTGLNLSVFHESFGRFKVVELDLILFFRFLRFNSFSLNSLQTTAIGLISQHVQLVSVLVSVSLKPPLAIFVSAYDLKVWLRL